MSPSSKCFTTAARLCAIRDACNGARRLPSLHGLGFRHSSTTTKTTTTTISTTDKAPPVLDRQELQRILDQFQAPVRYCFAYGSAVFPQRYGNKQDPTSMVDFVFGVTHPQHWHSLNLRQFPEHYSFLRYFGSRTVQLVQENFGASMYYNTGVEVNGRRIKYGVVSMEHLCSDLDQWDTLYMAGRTQKPIQILRNDARAQLCLQRNRKSALMTALLMLPAEFTEEELFMKITGLSYTGDIRLKLYGEDPHKIFNIVYRQLEDFRDIYAPLVDLVPNVNYLRDGFLEQDKSVKAVSANIRALPPLFREKLIAIHRQRSKQPESMDDLRKDDFIHAKITELALSARLEETVTAALSRTVFWPSVTQSAKGILTAGVSQSIRYAARKYRKANLQSLLPKF